VSGVRRPISGHVYRVERKAGPVWFAKYRLADGRQIKKRVGPAWTRRGRPQDGYFTRRIAQDWLDELLTDARRGEMVGVRRTGVRFADAAAEWLRYCEQERACKQSTLGDYKTMVSVLNRDLGEQRLEDIDHQVIERWRARFTESGRRSNRTVQKYLVALHGIFKRACRVYGLPVNPVALVERPRLKRTAGIDVLSGDEIKRLLDAAATEQDATLYLTAAYTGLRLGELLGLRWEDIDFEGDTIRVRRSWTNGEEGTPKSGRDRAVPMIESVAKALKRQRTRDRWISSGDLVFCDPLGRHLGVKSLRDRYKTALAAAHLRKLRFHDLRHTFGTHAIRHADPREVMEWMGHSDLATTQKYLAYKPRADAARRLSAAFD